MSIKYSDLVYDLRAAAQSERKHLEDNGLRARSVFAEKLEAAADAIETMSNSINAYCDAAFQRAQECDDLKKRINELERNGSADAICKIIRDAMEIGCGSVTVRFYQDGDASVAVFPPDPIDLAAED